MARISKYNIDTEVTKNDLVIGTDSQTNFTRNFKLEDLTKFFAKQQQILGNKFSYTYDQGSAFTSLGSGKISFNNKSITQTPFSGITSIYLNRYNNNAEDVYEFITELQDQGGVLNIYNGNVSTNFGVFRIQAINLDQNDVIQLTVDLLASNGTITGGDLTIVVGEFTSGDKSYIHTQLTASTSWTIDHALGKYPSVTIVDSGNNVVVGDIQYNTTNQLTVTFQSSVSGKAYIN
jgi:hypothetical protein